MPKTKENYGFMGKILHIKLNELSYEVIPTERYKEWGGGHGMGSALFWDYCEDKTIQDGRDPKNVCIVAASPFSGTPTPSAGGRCEVVGVGVGLQPIGWFTRSNFGGRFSSMMKYAGWDAVMISGKAPYPVWVDIRNDKVKIHKAKPLWGKTTKETQEMIIGHVGKDGNNWGWDRMPSDKGVEYTTKKPAVLCIGQAGEHQMAQASLIHESSNGAGQGGFGAVWGSKNLKAISIIGTNAVKIADPMALVEARFQTKELYAADPHKPDAAAWGPLGAPAKPVLSVALPTDKARVSACHGCINGCRGIYALGYGNQNHCNVTSFYAHHAMRWAKGDRIEASKITMQAGTICNELGLNTYPLKTGLPWLWYLHKKGILGKGKQIHTDIDFSKMGSVEFAKEFLHALAYGEDIGKDIAYYGFVPTAIKWGREEDWKNGRLKFTYWGMPEHGYDPRAELEWGFESLVADRDMNSHCVNWIFWHVNVATIRGLRPRIDADTLATLVTDKMRPWVKSKNALNYATENMYSDDVMDLARWHLFYTRYWKNSGLLCDFRWADLFNSRHPQLKGATASDEAGEHIFWNAITGENLSFNDGIKRGQRIYHLDNAIWTLQGRKRDMLKFADYIYDKPFDKGHFPFYMWPVIDDKSGKWVYRDVMHRSLDRDKMEDWKTRFYTKEKLDPKTGWPTLESLEAYGLDFIADELKQHGKLGDMG